MSLAVDRGFPSHLASDLQDFKRGDARCRLSSPRLTYLATLLASANVQAPQQASVPPPPSQPQPPFPPQHANPYYQYYANPYYPYPPPASYGYPNAPNPVNNAVHAPATSAMQGPPQAPPQVSSPSASDSPPQVSSPSASDSPPSASPTPSPSSTISSLPSDTSDGLTSSASMEQAQALAPPSVSTSTPPARSLNVVRVPFPVAGPPPPQPTHLYQIDTSNRKPGPDAVYRELALIEGHISNLMHTTSALQEQMEWARRSQQANEDLMEYWEEAVEAKRIAIMKDMVAKWKELRQDGGDSGNESDDDEDDDDSFSDSDGEEADARKRKDKHPAVTQLVTETFMLFLDVPKLSDKDLLPVIGEGEDINTEYPPIRGDTTGKIRQVRFVWDKPASHPHNHRSLGTIIQHAETFGHTYVAGVAKRLEKLPAGMLKKRFRERFDRLRKLIKGTDGKKSTKPGQEFTRGMSSNRAPGKLKIRIRKRNQLPRDHKYRDQKYDAAMEVQIQSDDEDCYDANGTLVPNEYCSIAPTWRSPELIDFFKTVDEQKDPRPSPQTRPRKKGTPRHMPLRPTAKAKGRVHRWMVDDEWWAQHGHENDSPQCIILDDDLEATEAVAAVKEKRKATQAAKKGRKTKKAKKA